MLLGVLLVLLFRLLYCVFWICCVLFACLFCLVAVFAISVCECLDDLLNALLFWVCIYCLFVCSFVFRLFSWFVRLVVWFVCFVYLLFACCLLFVIVV